MGLMRQVPLGAQITMFAKGIDRRAGRDSNRCDKKYSLETLETLRTEERIFNLGLVSVPLCHAVIRQSMEAHRTH
jgi:hypothetical protein